MNRLLKRVFAIALIFAALIFAPKLIGEQGYILISFGLWTIEGSIFQFLAAILVSAIVIYCVVKLIQYVFLMIIWPSKWWQKFHANKSISYYESGQNLMALGQWHLACEEFLRVRRTERIESAQSLSLICAAHANQPELTERVFKALNIDPLNADSSTFRSMKLPFAQLVIACESQDYESAYKTLQAIDLPVLKQTTAFQQLWLRINIINHNWQAVDQQLPKINKQIKKQSTELVYDQWLLQLSEWFATGFSSFVTRHSMNQLEQAWAKLSKSSRQLQPIVFAYMSALAKAQQSDKIESILLEQKKHLDNEFVLSVVRRYYQVNHAVQMDRLLSRVQKHLSNSPDDKVLLTLLGYLAAGQRDHQLSKQALQKVVYSQNNVTDTKLFAQELALLGETQKSLEVYHSL